MTDTMLREPCPRCAMKHVAQARALFKESKKGYPHHYWYALGHLAEAEDELEGIMPAEMEQVRAARKEWEQDMAKVPDFEFLLYAIAKGACLPEVEG